MSLVLFLLASFAMKIWLLAKLASISDQAPNTDVGQTIVASFAGPLRTIDKVVGSTDQASSQQLQMWFSEHF